MSYPFPPELQQLVREGLAAGNYRSEDEMLLEAVQLLRGRDADLQRFKQNLNKRLDGLDRGEGVELEDDEALGEFFDEIEAEVLSEIATEKTGQ